MHRRCSSFFTVLGLLSLIFTLTGQSSVFAQDEQPPGPDPYFNANASDYRTQFMSRPMMGDGQSQAALPAALTLGQPGLSFRYVQTLGVTEQPYFSDTIHINRPLGLFMDVGNNLYVAEEFGNRVLEYNSAGNNLLELGQAGICITDNYLFCNPRDMALDASGNLWVADGNRVVEYDASGTFLRQLPEINAWEPGTDNTHFDFVNGIAFDGAGRMYVSDTNNHRVQVYTFSGGSPVYHSTIGVTGQPGSDASHFNFPYRMAVDSSNRIYVTDRDNNRVQRCTLSGTWTCTTFASGLNGPQGITIDGSNNVFIADTYNGRIRKCLSNGTCSDFAFTPSGPYDVAVDSSGNVYAAAPYSAIVVKYNSSGGSLGIFLGTEGVPYLTDSSQYYQPRIAIDGQNNIIIIEELGQRLTKLDPNGNFMWSAGVPGVDVPDNTHFVYPHGVATDKNGNIYVAEANRVQVFSGAGTYLSTMGGTSGTGNYEFAWASGIGVDRNNGNIYVSDANNHRVQVYNSSHVYLATMGVTGVPGSDNSHFNYPIGVEVDASGNIYVADIANCRVQKFNSSRVYVKTFGTTGSCTNSFADLSAEDVTVDASGRVYVAGWDNRVQVFDSNGAYLTTIGGSWGNQPSQFRGASGVAVDSLGNVYVSDFTNARLQKFAPGVPGWQQVNINGFGDPTNQGAMSMAVFNNQLYAGAGNWDGAGASIWRTSDDLNWSPATTGGFGSPAANAAIVGMMAFKGKLYAGAGWGGVPHGAIGQLWRTSDGTTWSQVTGNGIESTPGPLGAFAVYGDTLYAGTCGSGTSGVQIWRSSTGDNMTWSTVVTGGLTTTDNSCITSLASFNGALYAAVENQVSGAQVWRSTTGNSGSWTQVNTSGFGSGDDLTSGFAIYNGYLYIGTRGGTGQAALWRSDNGTNWSPVTTDGFGDFYNWKIESLFVFNGSLYAGVNNATTGLEVWRTNNGTTWSQANPDGFGDSNNQSTLWSNETIVFNNSLHMGVFNSANGVEIWNLLPKFADVPFPYWASSFIERLYAAGITGGCSLSPLNYCPEDTVTRAQMAVFLLRGIHGASYAPPGVGAGTGFGDVPPSYWSATFIKQLAAEGITTGCGNGNYCPEHPVTRAQMAVFLLRSKYGAGYVPPDVAGSTGFGDVPANYWSAAWIKQLVTEGITSGCGGGNYCPEQPVTRAQMAVFLVRTFGLP
jgi:sugar lactone lactonase YvrE